jgi:hypothetical protein
MKNLFKNWKTTLAGIVTSASVIVPVLAPQYAPIAKQIFGLTVALGLIAAKDGDKTGV